MSADYLPGLPRFADAGAAAYRPGLERMRRLLAALGEPHRAFPSVHVAGTNGKGSTASFLAAICQAAGLRTGLHTSPHLRDVRERLRVDGRCAPADWFGAAAARLRPHIEAAGASFFEATVALSFLYFAERAVDVAVVEVGLGGRLDATNVLHPLLSIITHVGLDHTDLLGPDTAAIAAEKAGIFKPGAPALSGAADPAAAAVIRARARALGAPLTELAAAARWEAAGTDGLRLDLTTPHAAYRALDLGLPGLHQAANAALAVLAAEAVLPGLAPSGDLEKAVRAGLREVVKRTGLQGRLQQVGAAPAVFVDVAHNPEGLAAALAYVRSRYPADRHPLTALFGAMADKDAAGMAAALAAAGASVFAVALETPRALPAAEAARLAAEAGCPVLGQGPLAEGLARFHEAASPEAVLLAAGSFHVAAAMPGVGGCP